MRSSERSEATYPQVIHRLSTGYTQALRASLRLRAKRAPPSYTTPRVKKEALREALRAL